MGPAMSQLFGNAASIFVGAAIFSDLVEHAPDEEFLASVAEHLERNQVLALPFFLPHLLVLSNQKHMKRKLHFWLSIDQSISRSKESSSHSKPSLRTRTVLGPIFCHREDSNKRSPTPPSWCNGRQARGSISALTWAHCKAY